MKRISIIILLLLSMSAMLARTSIFGTGRGASHEEAFAEAQVQIAQQISVRVEAVSEFQSLDIEADGQAFYAQSIEKSTRLTVDQLITGIEVISSIDKKDGFEVEARLKISTLLNSLTSEMDQIKSSASTLLSDAIQLQKSGKPLIAIKNYTDAQELVPGLYAKKSIYDAFADYNYAIPDELSISALESAMRNLISRLSFEVYSGDRQSAPIGSNLPYEIIFTALYRDESDGVIPVSGFPVKISYGDGTLIEKANTDAQGQIPVRAKAHQLSGANKIVCSSDAQMLPAYLGRILNLNTAVAYYEVEAAMQTEVAIIVKDERGYRLENLERSVAKALSNSGFVVSENADLQLEGRIITGEVKLQEGMAAPQYVAKVQLELQLKRRSSGRGLGSFSAEGVGISTKSEADAIKNASGKVNINARKLSTSLNEYLEMEN